MSDPAVVRQRILVVDDEMNIRKTLALCLQADGHSVALATSFEDALREAERESFDIALVDVRLGVSSGLDLIEPLQRLSPALKIVVMTAYASIETAVEAMRRGATDYLAKPFTPEQVRIAVGKASELRSLERRLETLEQDLKALHPEAVFASASTAMERVLGTARHAAGSEATILLRGESGTGKTVLARAIHGWSRRADRPFVVVSCPALSPELLESELFGHARGAFTGALSENAGRIAAADGGTLFLDEIGDLPLPLQPKLLRFLQDHEYERVGESRVRRADVRVLVATNVDLHAAVEAGRFRQDLLYRLNVIELVVPPLRERPADVGTIADGMLGHFAAQNHKILQGFSPEAREALVAYPWPGNLRELRNVVERAVIFASGRRVELGDLPESFIGTVSPPRLGSPLSLSEIEEHHIRYVLSSVPSLQDAATILGIDQATLWRKRKKYGI